MFSHNNLLILSLDVVLREEQEDKFGQRSNKGHYFNSRVFFHFQSRMGIIHNSYQTMKTKGETLKTCHVEFEHMSAYYLLTKNDNRAGLFEN